MRIKVNCYIPLIDFLSCGNCKERNPLILPNSDEPSGSPTADAKGVPGVGKRDGRPIGNRFTFPSLSNSPRAPPGGVEQQNNITKAAWKFVLDHKRGSLATALNIVSDCNLNLTKIQSLPVIETPGKYAFFVDVTFSDTKDYYKAKSMMEIMATAFKVLGEYTSGKS